MMASSWISHIAEEELLALIPSEALDRDDDPDRALQAIDKELVNRGVLEPLSGSRIASKMASPKKKMAKRPTKKASKKLSSPPVAVPSAVPPLWRRIKSEFRLLFCTTDKKYAKTRTALAKHGNGATVMIVSTISAAIGAALGMAAGVCVPFIAMLLLTVTAVGKNVYCGSGTSSP